MSTTIDDILHDMFMQELGEDERTEELRQAAIFDFKLDRMRDYYLQNRAVLVPAFHALDEGRRLLPLHPGASLLYSMIAVEVGIRKGMLRPVLRGSIHQDWVLDLLPDALLGRLSNDRMSPLFGGVLDRLAPSPKGPAAKMSTEVLHKVSTLQKLRNGISHDGATVTDSEAARGLELASYIVETVATSYLESIGLCLDNSHLVCAAEESSVDHD